MRKIWLMDDRNVISGEIAPFGNAPEDALFLTLVDAAVVRRWGTKHGLGQLGLEGPQEETKLDLVANGHRINLAYVLEEFAVSPEAERKWADAIRKLRGISR